ncbi:hypothetical protein Ciccas_014467, partial [Cichlidogyrus casuarinus]
MQQFFEQELKVRSCNGAATSSHSQQVNNTGNVNKAFGSDDHTLSVLSSTSQTKLK